MNIKALSGADLARCFGVDRAMVTRWKKAGMPEEKGVFQLPLCIKWRLDREADAMAPKGASEEGEKWLTAFRRERARAAKLDRLARQGELMPVEEIFKEWIKRVGEARQGLLSLPTRISPLVEGKAQDEIRAEIKKEVCRLLENFSRDGQFTPKEKKK